MVSMVYGGITGWRAAFFAGISFLSLTMAVPAPALAQQAPAPSPIPAATPPLPRVDLKLFEKGEIDRSKGCTFVLWQHDRDPEKDRYAYVFAEALGRNQARENARIKVGNDVITFRRVAVGGAKEFGYKTFPSALYKAEKEESYLILELKLEDSPGEVLDVDSGTLTIIRPRHVPFVANVKGNGGCNTPAAAQPPAPRAAAATPAPQPQAASRQPALVPPGMFERMPLRPNAVPAKLRADAVKRLGCDDLMLRQGGTSYALSEESALWELTCQRFPANTSKIFALVYAPDPAKDYQFRTFDVPRGQPHQGNPAELYGPAWDMRTKIVSSTYTEGNGSDCGVFQRHQLTDEGKFVLIEYRTKETCDGKSMKPTEFPLLYRR